MRLLYQNLFDLGTLTASSEVANLPATNLKNKILKKVWRTTGISGQYLTADLGSAQLINSASFFYHNFTVNGTFRLRAANVSDFSTCLLDQTFDIWEPLFGFGDAGYGIHGLGGIPSDSERSLYTSFSIQFISQIEARYWRWDFLDAGNSDGYFQIGRMFLAYYLEPVVNFPYNWDMRWADPGLKSKSIGGQAYVDLKTKFREVSFDLDRLTDDEKYNIVLFFQNQVGIGNDMVICLFTDKTDYRWFHTTIYGRFKDNVPLQNTDYALNKASFGFEESV